MFLSHASLEAGDNQAAEGQEAVQLMTIHSAKGLEFNAVFITGLEEGLFPHENSISEPDGLAEERRLMYVALTRARRRLYLSFSQTRMLHGQTRYNMRSRFFDELPEETLRWLTPRMASRSVVSAAWESSADTDRSAWGQDRPAGQWTRQGMGSTQTNTASPSYRLPPVSGHQHDSGLKVGQAVRHSRFGDGVVLALEGSGNDARAQVNFKREGPKWLALSVAKLETIDP
jgi:DNA helicase-2/ATP-dependent DNA helicase PcrA